MQQDTSDRHCRIPLISTILCQAFTEGFRNRTPGGGTFQSRHHWFKQRTNLIRQAEQITQSLRSDSEFPGHERTLKFIGEHRDDAQFHRPPELAKCQGFSPPFSSGKSWRKWSTTPAQRRRRNDTCSECESQSP